MGKKSLSARTLGISMVTRAENEDQKPITELLWQWQNNGGNVKLTRQNFKQFLRKERTRRKMTRIELAKEFGMSHRTVEAWENGTLPPRGMVEFYNFMNRK